MLKLGRQTKKNQTRLTPIVLAGLMLVASVLMLPPICPAEDWPMWRYDANRSAASPQELPARLHLQWVRQYPRLTMAWKDPINQDRMPFDRVYEPVVMGQRLFLGFNSSDKVVALDTHTGQELWSFYADGPVRLPPVAWQGKVYFVSDDGYLYCVDAASGLLVWKFQGGPSDRRILGNQRLISSWSARGGPVIADGTVYFAASIWPFMGIFIHALDAKTGKVVWTNDGSGATFMDQPHDSPAFAGVAPQGALVIIGDKLLVPGGRSVPACFDRQTGRMLYYRLADNGKRGGSHVSAIGNHFFNHRGLGTYLYDLATGDLLISSIGNLPVLTESAYYFSGNPVVALNAKSLSGFEYEIYTKDRRTGELVKVKRTKWLIGYQWECPVDAAGALIKAGSHLYAGGTNAVSAIRIPAPGGKPEVVWTAGDVEGQVSRIIAADDRLFVVTLEGRIYCFAGKVSEKPVVHPYTTVPISPAEAMSAQAKAILEHTGIRQGYCLAFGITDARLVEELARQSELHIVGFCPEASRLCALRRRLDAAGLYGSRVALHTGDPLSVGLPPYLASLTVFEDLEGAGFARGKAFLDKVFRSLRPYGGTACLCLSGESRRGFTELVKTAGLHGARVEEKGDLLLLLRQGALAGSASWTHQYGTIANTVKSDDQLVRAPLGLLWFGGSSHLDVLPRHGHGPPEQVIGGRLFIEGINCLSARDVYTGRVLWKRELPHLNTFGVYYDSSYNPDPLDTSYNQNHLPGANARGSNFVATADRVYIIHGKGCLALDPATGATLGEFRLPAPEGATKSPEWGYIGAYKDLLIAGARPVKYTHYHLPAETDRWQNFDSTSSSRLVVMNRYTGKVIWSRDACLGFRHSAIAVRDDKLFCIDMAPAYVSGLLDKLHPQPAARPWLMALEVYSGRTLWSTTRNIFGTWLGYSHEHDTLLQAGRSSRDMLDFEPDSRMIAYRASTGKVLWKKQREYNGPPMLHGDTIITQGQAFNLLTGERIMRSHPLTGEKISWKFKRGYGCNTDICSEHLITFRSAAAGFFDLDRGGGTANLGGFKSGCTSNLVAADGVLNAPDYTRTCTCSYQNQTSLAMVYMPTNQLWTFSDLGPDSVEGKRIKRVGINLGAPGDRMGHDRVLWLDYPSVGGRSPNIPVHIEPQKPGWFRRHSSAIQAGSLPWVAASGCKGLRKLELTLAPEAHQEQLYSVRLYFAEPDNLKSGKRTFSVYLQGRLVLNGLDIVKEAKGRLRTVVKTFTGIGVKDRLVVELKPSPGAGVKAPVLCGIEVQMELGNNRQAGDQVER